MSIMLHDPSHISQGRKWQTVGENNGGLGWIKYRYSIKFQNVLIWAERGRKLFLRGSRKRLWRRCLLDVMLLPFCPQGSAKAKTEDNSWLLNSEGNRGGIFVKGRGKTLLYWYKWGQGKHFVLRKIRKTAANKSIIARNRTRTSKEPWNKNGSKSTNHKLQTVTFWTLWNERILPKRSDKEARNWQVTQT